VMNAVRLFEMDRRYAGAVVSYLAADLCDVLTNFNKAEEAIEECKECGCLHIQDIGFARWYNSRNPDPSAAMENLWAVIHHRHHNRLPMYISSNLIGDNLWAKFHPDYREPLRQRIIEACYQVDFDHPQWSFEAEYFDIKAKLVPKAAAQAQREIVARWQKAKIDAARAARADAECNKRAAEQAEEEKRRTEIEIAQRQQQEDMERVAAIARAADEALLAEAVKTGSADGLPDHLHGELAQRKARAGLETLRARWGD